MKIGIMQPYFFPYIGYFAIMHYVDKWIVFDDAQYIYHGWINRNRILNFNKDWQYITVPIRKHCRTVRIKDVLIANQIQWRQKLFAQLLQYRQKAPYYKTVIEVLHCAFEDEIEKISILNLKCLEVICDYLGISVDIIIYSDREWNLGEIVDPDDWALRISENFGANEYINPPNGKLFFSENKWNTSPVDLKFLRMKEFKYNQKRKFFIPDLSVIDVMMFLDPTHIREAMENYEFI